MNQTVHQEAESHEDLSSACHYRARKHPMNLVLLVRINDNIQNPSTMHIPDWVKTIEDPCTNASGSLEWITRCKFAADGGGAIGERAAAVRSIL